MIQYARGTPEYYRELFERKEREKHERKVNVKTKEIERRDALHRAAVEQIAERRANRTRPDRDTGQAGGVRESDQPASGAMLKSTQRRRKPRKCAGTMGETEALPGIDAGTETTREGNIDGD